ncbi:MAG: glycosyltransferase [Proteobacteria bacterium]|nr:glycosyltransferase [Pseudomonadota bacterium]
MMSNPKVALFSTQFCAYSQTFVWDEVTSHKRYDIDVYTLHRLYPERFPYDRVFTLDQNPLEKLFCESLLYSPTCAKHIAANNYALIAAHFGPGSLYALPHAQRFHLPLIVTFHGYDVPLLWNLRKLQPQYWRYWALSPWMLHRVDRFLAASEELHNMLIDIGAPEEKVFTWRLGIRIPELSAIKQPSADTVPQTRKLIQVGRFVEKKGYIYSLRAMHILKNMYRAAGREFNVLLTCIGDGECKPECERYAQTHNLEENVRFVDNMPQDEVFAEMQDSEILLCPSLVARNGDRESGILVAKEAAARCIPVIGTYHGGIPDIIEDGKTGFIVQERDAQAIAERIDCILSNPQLRCDLGTAARKKMENEYRLEDRVDALEKHYDEVIAQFN